MTIFSQAGYDNHEAVHAFCDADADLRGFIAIHSTALGPAFGGCRVWTYIDDGAALTDALETDTSSSRDVKVACVVALGLAPAPQVLPRH